MIIYDDQKIIYGRTDRHDYSSEPHNIQNVLKVRRTNRDIKGQTTYIKVSNILCLQLIIEFSFSVSVGIKKW